MRPHPFQRLVGLPAVLGTLLLITACGSPEPAQPFVARVGNALLTQEEVSRLLVDRSPQLDSSDAISQIVEQWVTNQLLYQEARDRGLKSDADVQRLLADNERSVMVDALVSRMLDEEMGDGPDDAAIQTYYEQHRDQLALREPFVRVIHLVFEDADSASAARRQLVSSSPPDPEELSGMSDRQLDLASFYPQQQLFAAIPGLGEAVASLRIGQVTPVLERDGAYHIVQLTDRLEEGTVPALDMIRDEISHRVTIQMRKQLYARQVQRLRTRAMAREELEIR